MATDNTIKDPEFFFRNYRKMWLGLVILTYLWLPVATLGFLGFLPWLSPAIALLTFFSSFGLHLTLFVAGRWSAEDGFTALEVKKRKTDA